MSEVFTASSPDFGARDHALGCRLSPYDARDYKINSVKVCASNLPKEFSRTPPDVKNQRSVCSCVAHAVSSILEYHAGQEITDIQLSTNFIYGIQKELFNNTGKGMYLREACKIVKDYGDMLEEDCSGNTEVPDCYPIAEGAMDDENKVRRAFVFHIDSYYSCYTYDDIKQALVNHGPVLLAVKWWDDFKVNQVTKVLYRANTKSGYGYHAIMVYGYNEKGLLCQNSWGSNWGSKGRFIYPYDLPFSEARGLIDCLEDHDIDDLIIPNRNKFLDLVYKFLNSIVNFFIRLFNKE